MRKFAPNFEIIMADKKTNKVKYSEPADYFPKEIRDSFKSKTPATKKKSVKGTKKKVK